MCLLLISEILALFVNTLPPNGKYSLRISENFFQPIQKKELIIQKVLPQFFARFLKFKSTIEHF